MTQLREQVPLEYYLLPAGVEYVPDKDCPYVGRINVRDGRVDVEDIGELTEPEMRVVALNALGHSTKQIHRMTGSTHTIVKRQLISARREDALNAYNPPHAIDQAFRLGMFVVARAIEAPDLTAREYDALHLVSQGYTKEGIGQEMGKRSVNTAMSHLRSMRTKFGAPSSSAAVLLGHMSELLPRQNS
ncbi:MAG TPA: LuxR C-terminal-related transcriptional regulator [Candidatus Saccharimonadales bacterium]|nr:LuxR C-terminal-related transcriptional regulator [Candidatus Saccharimonadales bacterium]